MLSCLSEVIRSLLYLFIHLLSISLRPLHNLLNGEWAPIHRRFILVFSYFFNYRIMFRKSIVVSIYWWKSNEVERKISSHIRSNQTEKMNRYITDTFASDDYKIGKFHFWNWIQIRWSDKRSPLFIIIINNRVMKTSMKLHIFCNIIQLFFFNFINKMKSKHCTTTGHWTTILWLIFIFGAMEEIKTIYTNRKYVRRFIHTTYKILSNQLI